MRRITLGASGVRWVLNERRRTVVTKVVSALLYLLLSIEKAKNPEGTDPVPVVERYVVDESQFEVVSASVEAVDADICGMAEADEYEFVPDPLVPESYYDIYGESGLAEEFFYDDLDLLALIVMGEAEGESEYGKRLVVDTVMNRVYSENFPDTISEVVYAKGQFECTWNGRCDGLEPTDEVYDIVYSELALGENRANTEVLYFCSLGYNGPTPLFKEDHHYFSK